MVSKIKNEYIDPSLLLSEKSEEAQKTKKSSLQSFTDGRRANAWQLARWPLHKNMTWDRVQIYLPRSYLAKDGEDIRTISMGEDINQFVHRYYLESVDLKTNDWVNFVHTDKVIAKRYDSSNSRCAIPRSSCVLCVVVQGYISW